MWAHLSARPSRCSVQTYTRGDRLSFDCHFGTKECQGNIYHACAVAHIPGAEEQLDYIRCMINDNYDPSEAALRCTREVEVDWEAIQRCATTTEGKLLHKVAGEKTQTLEPKVSIVKYRHKSTLNSLPVLEFFLSFNFYTVQCSECSAGQWRQCHSNTLFIKLFLFVQKFFSSAGEENKML